MPNNNNDTKGANEGTSPTKSTIERNLLQAAIMFTTKETKVQIGSKMEKQYESAFYINAT